LNQRDRGLTVVAIQVPLSDVRRGTPTWVESGALTVTIRNGLIRFEIELPPGYPDGPYRIAVVDGFDEPLVDLDGRAVDRRLIVLADTAGLATGRRFLRVTRDGQPPDYLPVIIAASSKP